jgi:protoporphyrinogen oxidase
MKLGDGHQLRDANEFGSDSVVIIGGGLSGLVAGCLLARSGISAPIIVVESASEPGGLLRSFDGGQFGRFDHGMHTFTSANVPDLDEFMLGLLPRDEWVVMAGKQRDISGVYFRGKLQRACHYPDLRSLPEPLQRDCISELCLNLGKAEQPSETFEGFVTQRFGKQIGEHVFAPIANKMYGMDTGQLDPVVASVFPMDRIALYDEPDFLDLMNSLNVRKRIAYPEQRNLDIKYASTRYSLYPKEFGAFRLIDALMKRLSDSGGKLLTATKLEKITTSGGRVESLTVRRGDDTFDLKSPSQIFWTAGYLGLGRMLGLEAAAKSFESRRKPAVVSLLLDKPVDLGDLYYFWNWDPDFKSYRITNYCGYCPTAPRAGGYPIGFEFVLAPDDPVDTASLGDLAVQELKAMGLYPEGAKVLFSIGGVLPVGFPTFSLENRRRLMQYQKEFGALGLSNLAVTGIQAEWGVIYQPEVLSHTHKTVQAYLERVQG